MQRNAHSVAISKGFPFIDTDGGDTYNNTFFNRFTKNAERTGPCLYVGYNQRTKRWEVYYDKLPQHKQVYVMYQLEAIGEGGELEAENVLRFCSAQCREKYHEDPKAAHILAFYGQPIDRIFEGEHESKKVFYPDGTSLLLLCKGTEDGPGDEQEVCNQCGVVLQDVIDDRKPRRYLRDDDSGIIEERP